jgi:hypothetical protein
MAENNYKNEQDNATYKQAYDSARAGYFHHPVDVIVDLICGENPVEKAGREAGTADRIKYGSK